MNKNIIIALMLLLALKLQAQNQFINNGAVVKIQNGAIFKINNAGVLNKNNGAINNDGTIYLEQNFNQTTGATYLDNATSLLEFKGSGNQSLTSDAPLSISKLSVNNGNNLILGNNLLINTDVDLRTNGNVELGNFDLSIAAGATISNYDATHYIITNGTGYLQQEVGATNIIFPVGNSSYNPAILNNAGVADNFQIRVVDQVFSQGTTGTIQTSNIVNRTWMIEETILGGSDVTMTLQWSTADELVFDRLNSGIAHHISGGTWDYTPSYTAATIIGSDWSQTRSNFTSFSPFVVTDMNADLPIELLSFDAQRQDIGNVQLNWVTASELNNKGFYIERMLHLENEFEPIGFVDGKGTTSATSNYEFIDDNTYSGVSYYRLRQVDFDGTMSYSMIKAVSGSKFKEELVDVFPNPIQDCVNVLIKASSTKVIIKIYDMKGILVNSLSNVIPTNGLIKLSNLQGLEAGTYMLVIVTDEDEIITKKIVKQ